MTKTYPVRTNHIEQSILVTGCQRSGTTLLRTILGQHPAILEHPDEPHFILELYQRFGMTIHDLNTAVTYLSKHPYRPPSLSPDTLQVAYAGKEKLSLALFLQIYLETWGADELITKRPLLKDPAFIFNLELIGALFPHATLIHVIRDPRANINSQKTRWPHYTTWETAHLWRQAVDAPQNRHNTCTLSVIEVRYEDILLNPQESIALLCQQLNLPFSPDLLSFHQETTGFQPGGKPQAIVFKTVDRSRLNQWQHHLTAYDVRLIEQICQPTMNEWGYELIRPSLANYRYYPLLLKEWVQYQIQHGGRCLKNLFRRVGWQFGVGLLTIPPKSKPEQ
ncbi:MAG: sulfotransferase [Anaerolineae bacterium]|nr:sulfotransferase [Anaerolineae bacterium]